MHVQHVRPNRDPTKEGAPTGQRLSDASTTFSDLWGGAYLCRIATFKTCIYQMFLYINVRKCMWGRGPHIFTEQGPIGFKSGPAYGI